MPSFTPPFSLPRTCLVILLTAFAFAIALPSSGETLAAPPTLRSYQAWQKACSQLLPNRALNGRYPPRETLPLKDGTEFSALVDAFFAQSKSGPLAEPSHWLGTAPDPTIFFDPSKHYYRNPGARFAPFVQKLPLPAGATVIIHGDLHGDVSSLLHGLDALNRQGYLDGFKIVKPNAHLLFLGDYCDRGLYGVEVIYTLLRLKLENPDHVWLVRGNHEDVSMIANYGFGSEGLYKFGRSFDLFKVSRLYDFLPVALYLGCGTHYAQCNHGGMEAGFNPSALLQHPDARYQLLGELKRADFLEAHPDILVKADETTKANLAKRYRNFTPTSPSSLDSLGFMWGDFAVVPDHSLLRWDLGRPGWMFGKELTQRLLTEASSPEGPQVHAVFRAHQHSTKLNPMMKRLIASRGVFRHWQDQDSVSLLDASLAELESQLERSPSRKVVEGGVYTFNVSPDSRYGTSCKYDFDTFGMVTLASSFSDWTLEVINPIPGKP